MADKPVWSGSTLVAGAVVVAFVIGVIAGNSMNSSPGSSEATVSSSGSGTQASSTTSAPDPAVTGEYTAGVYTVGEDIQPGTYSTPGADRCYWARLEDASGELSSIIANDNVSGRGVMTIEPSDMYVTFNGDCVWTER